ncbi:putative internalin [Reticulomyxa filosa]|uniref:Putative internalin n=1 Tax=Reticulomyxa filosa TaxID=46433 RepID=X6PB75_RETFI|nr:putative internalin [Reticulomyxa filosa]|eukprot:ETO35805.1 putative internalin [Reticulomyxa filosa]
MYLWYHSRVEIHQFTAEDWGLIREVEKTILPLDTNEAIEKLSCNDDTKEFLVHNFKDALYFTGSKVMNLDLKDISNDCVMNCIIPFLKHVPNISTLDLDCTSIDDSALIAILEQKQIDSLFVSNNNITDVGLRALTNNNIIKRLDISYTNFSIQGLNGLKHNDYLEELSCDQYYFKEKSIDFANDMQKFRNEMYANQKFSFLMGTHERVGRNSPILHSFYQSKLFDRYLVKEIFSYVKPKEIKGFKSAYHYNPLNREYREKRRNDLMRNNQFVDNSSLNNPNVDAIVQFLQEQNPQLDMPLEIGNVVYESRGNHGLDTLNRDAQLHRSVDETLAEREGNQTQNQARSSTSMTLR